MTVEEIMTRDVQCCGPETNLAAAAKMMWDHDCGVLPILNVQGQVMGMITDRDICMAASTTNRVPSAVTAWVSSKRAACVSSSGRGSAPRRARAWKRVPGSIVSW